MTAQCLRAPIHIHDISKRFGTNTVLTLDKLCIGIPSDIIVGTHPSPHR
ncbi:MULTISPECIES: hypothetical protein [unclassified Ochrobactrum]|jgi:hypothetical protein|nr:MULTISPECIES: hypothetical protein [unclassified Ochrobactrum]MBQ0711288.1 hypothetical protein [Ochrobactrum sp. AP1BH01-1]